MIDKDGFYIPSQIHLDNLESYLTTVQKYKDREKEIHRRWIIGAPAGFMSIIIAVLTMGFTAQTYALYEISSNISIPALLILYIGFLYGMKMGIDSIYDFSRRPDLQYDEIEK